MTPPRRSKVKLSAAVEGWTVAELDRFREDAGLSTRSAALCEALAQWARDYRKDFVLEKALAKYAKAYAKARTAEEQAASRMLPLIPRQGGRP